MKKGLAMLLLTAMIVGLTACGSKEADSTAPENTTEKTDAADG